MLRRALTKAATEQEGDFKVRGHDISRIEGLSDAVFGFAITLLIVSLEVPKTSGELLEAMRGFVAFGFTFFLLFMLWRAQFIFFRRYALEDRVTVLLNGALLFVVLFFIYPLKFIFGYLTGRLLGEDPYVHLANGTAVRAIAPEDRALLFLVYGLGMAAVFTVFTLLYRHAYNKREALDLDALEVHDTLTTVRVMSHNALLGLTMTIAQAVMYVAQRRGASLNFRDNVDLAMSVAVLGIVVRMLRVRHRAKVIRAQMKAGEFSSVRTTEAHTIVSPDVVAGHAHH